MVWYSRAGFRTPHPVLLWLSRLAQSSSVTKLAEPYGFHSQLLASQASAVSTTCFSFRPAFAFASPACSGILFRHPWRNPEPHQPVRRSSTITLLSATPCLLYLVKAASGSVPFPVRFPTHSIACAGTVVNSQNGQFRAFYLKVLRFSRQNRARCAHF